MTEASLTNKMRLAIKKRGGWARKAFSGPQGKGWPDLVAVYRGYGLFLEVKLPGKEKTLTKIQAAALADIKSAGGVARMVTTVDELNKLMDAIDRRKDR